MFTEKDLQDAIEAGIFDKYNNVTAPPAKVIRFFETWAKEREKRLRHAAAEIAVSEPNTNIAHQKIMNLSIKK